MLRWIYVIYRLERGLSVRINVGCNKKWCILDKGCLEGNKWIRSNGNVNFGKFKLLIILGFGFNEDGIERFVKEFRVKFKKGLKFKEWVFWVG